MTITNVPASKIKQAVYGQFEEFRNNSSCQPVTVIDWIGENINAISDAITNQPSRLIENGTSNWTVKVKVVDGHPFLVFEASWTYMFGPSNPSPNIDELDKLLPDIEIKEITAAYDSYGLTLEMIFDAYLWSSFVPYITYTNLDFSLHATYGIDQARKDALADALTLAKYFYPSLNEKMLALGEELGMFDTLQTFEAWCPANAHVTVKHVELPNDLDNPGAHP